MAEKTRREHMSDSSARILICVLIVVFALFNLAFGNKLIAFASALIALTGITLEIYFCCMAILSIVINRIRIRERQRDGQYTRAAETADAEADKPQKATRRRSKPKASEE